MSMTSAVQNAMPARKRLNHRGPLSIDVPSAWYFVTLCAAERCNYGRAVSMKPPSTPFMTFAMEILDAARFRHVCGKWRLALFLIMPDHIHFIARFPDAGSDASVSSKPPYRTDAIMRKVNVNRYDDRETVRTNLIEAFDALMAFGAKHLDDKFYLEGVQRVSVRGKILREVIANSLMHREFSSSMTARLVIERDRLFADNANRAAAHGIITPENVRPVSKNPIIAAFFKEIGRADELGSGTRNLYHYTRLYSGADPIIDEEDAFSVTVPLNDGYSPEVGKGTRDNDIERASVGSDTVNGTASGPLNGSLNGPLSGPLKDKVMNLIAGIPGVNRMDLVCSTGVSERTMTRNLSELERTGKIERRGSKKTGGYFLVEGSGEKRTEGQSK